MREERIIRQTALINEIGLKESTGRGWIKLFKEFIPIEYKGKYKVFNEKSIRVLKIIKFLNDNNLSVGEILDIFRTNGVPQNEKEAQLFIDNSKEKTSIMFDYNIAKSLPSQKDLIIPILNILRDGNPMITSMINDKIAQLFSLDDKQRNMIYEKSNDSVFMTRMRSARYSLKKEDYIEEVSKLTYQITENGLSLLNDNIDEIEDEINELEKVEDPYNVILEKVDEIESDLINDIIDILKQSHWRRLENIVVELLTAMGYGDGEVTERTNDGGLDGIIKEDRLGLDNIYVQAKRWENTIGRPEVMSFSGALDAKGARKGIFITTSGFTKGAQEYVEKLETKKIILINGKKLARLMIENNIGVSSKKKFIIKEVDFNYFEGE